MDPVHHDDTFDDNVFAALARRFPADGTRCFIEGFDGRRISYAAMDATTAQIARLLRGLGVGPGDRVAAVLDKSPEGILLYLASCRIGAVLVPVHVELTLPEMATILRDAAPRLLVCTPGLAGPLAALDGAAWQVLTLDAAGQGSLRDGFADLPGDTALAPGRAGDPNAIVYTSGTTGRPKGAVMTNGLVIWNAAALAARWGMTERDVLLHANPMAFGLFGTTTPVLAAGAQLRLLPRFVAAEVVAALPGTTLFAGVPTYYARLLAHPGFDRAACATIRLLITGSAPMRAPLFAAVQQRTGHAPLDRYGLTEALIATSMRADAPRQPDVSGTVLDGARLRVVDEAGQPVPPGAVGGIELWQPCMFGGYWQAPDKTRAAFRSDGWFITGDFGRLDADGQLCVLGRGVDLIISGGFNVVPKEVEAALDTVPGIAESAVVGVPHPDFGEAVVAVVEVADPAAPPALEEVRAELARSLARYKVPKAIHVVPRLPRNTLGKVQKAVLKKQFEGLFAGPPAGRA